jgi:hypothetical protein
MNEREQLLARIALARKNVENSNNTTEKQVWIRLHNKYVARLNRIKRGT